MIKIPVNTFNKTGDVVVGFRPEDITISSSPKEDAVEFIAYSVLPAGADTTIIARQGNIELTIKEMGVSKVQMDQKIWLNFDENAINLYDKESGLLISG